MKYYLIFFICFFSGVNSFSQHQNNTWYFGNHAGLNFNTIPPTALINSAMIQKEGCATISDNNGNLLFYTSGDTVWNRNHAIMQNGKGLKGNFSSTQSAVIVPKPCDSNIYYLFTVPAVEFGPDTLCYSILDMSLNGGLGDIAVKNIPLRTGVYEKITATIKGNGIDYWIITTNWNTDSIVCYSLTANGFNPVPVISHSGIIPHNNQAGYIRVSPDNSKLGVAYYGDSATVVLDFDDNNGTVSNPIRLSIPLCYGVEFSPDNSKIYVTQLILPASIHQFNLLAGSPTAIQNSEFVITLPVVAALALGPDNKIYVAGSGNYFLSVIDQPNQAGAGCNFIAQYINLAPGRSTLGLPNNIRQYSACLQCPQSLDLVESINICSNQTYQLPSGTVVNNPGTYLDTIRNNANTCDSIIYTINLSIYTVSLLNTSAHICPNQTYQLPSGTFVSAEGIYLDTLTNIAGCDSVINTVHLFVDHVSFQNTDAHICPNQTYQLPSGTIVSAEGIYLDTLRSQASCDSVITTTHLFIDHASLQNTEAHICPNQTYQLPSGTIISAEGVYIDTLRSQASCDSIINTIHLFIDHTALLNTNASICSNQTYQLPSGVIVSAGGIYLDTLRSQAQCDSIINTIHLVVNDLSFINQVDSIFAGQNYTLPSGIVVSAPGTYQSVLVNSLGCDSVITTTLTLRKTLAECITLKNAITPNGDGINDYWVLYRFPCFKKLEVSVYNRYGSLIYHSDDYKNDWNGKYKGKELPDGTYYYVLKVFAFDGKEHVFRNNVTILR